MTRVLEDRALAERLGAAARETYGGVAPDGRTNSRTPIASSSTACSPARADEARLRHADARSRRTARSRRRSTSSVRSPRAPTSVVVLCRTVDWDDDSRERRACGRSTRAARSAARWRSSARSRRRSRGADAVLVHMVPTFLALAAPLARARRVPLLLWYTHWHASRSLRLATRLADVVLSVDTASFPLADAEGARRSGMRSTSTRSSPPAGRARTTGRSGCWHSAERRAGRGSARCSTRSRAVDGDVSLEIRGPSLTPDEVAHRAELERRAPRTDDRVSRRARRSRAPRCRALLAAARRRRQPGRAARGRDARQGGLRGRRLRAAGRDDERRAGAVPRRAAAASSLAPPRDPAALAAALAAVVAASQADARRDRGRAATAGRPRSLARPLGGRGDPTVVREVRSRAWRLSPTNGEPVADVRSSRPYILSPMPSEDARRAGSRASSALVAIDIAGLVIGLYAALALRSLDLRPEADPLGPALGPRDELARRS